MKFAQMLFSKLFLFSLSASPLGRADQNEIQKNLNKYRQASIDINRASAEDFIHLPGVGPELARRIVAYRVKHGVFRRVEDLLIIRGIGPKKWRVLRPYLRVEQKEPIVGTGGAERGKV